MNRLFVLWLILLPSKILSFVLLKRDISTKSERWLRHLIHNQNQHRHETSLGSSENNQPTTAVYIDSNLTDARVRTLFAWISRAFAGDPAYNNLMLAMAAIFGANLPPSSNLEQMAKDAEALLPASEEALTGEPFSRIARERSSLGAMGAGQWMGQYMTRPHSLLDVSNITSIEDWVQKLPRGCRRTLKKANAQNFTVTSFPIGDCKPAPHSSLAHFRCVVEHEVRLIARYDGDTEGFFEALSTAVGRYISTTRMTGEIQEYRNTDGRVIAFAHEVRKGRAIRGQWFYGSDEAAKSYVWFHSVQELVRRAIEADGVDTADLGPSGSDAFSELKAKYGFAAVDDWPSVADYTGPFWYAGEQDRKENNDRNHMMNEIMRLLRG